MRAVPAIFTAFLALALPAQPLRAEDPIGQSRKVIEDQIKAFLADDAATAYSFAAPAIKGKFPDKDVFFAMVMKSYQPVYHPGNYAFSRSQTIGGGAIVIHELTISGRDGKNWKALYKLSRQPDDSYKIDGVAIVADTISKGI
jgi:hypothetical protein